jgi:hypothetical protein
MDVARMQQQTAREQMDWAREQDTMNRDTLNTVLGVQLPAMQDQFDNAREDRSRWETMFRPLEDQFVAEAQAYDSPERREREMGAAMADVNSAFDAQRQNATQRLESYGVDPSETRNAALDVGVRTAQAAAAAGAATGARNRTEDTGRALRSDALNLGRGALSQVAGSYGGAVGAGSSAVGGANQTTGTSSGAFQGSLGFSGQALQGFGQNADIQSQGYGNSMQGYNAKTAQTTGMLSGIGGIAGMMMADGGEAIDTGTGNGSGIDDTVPAMLSDGEYVIPADVVRIKGEEFFDRIIEKYHTPAAQQQAIGA